MSENQGLRLSPNQGLTPSTAEAPWPVRVVSEKIAKWIDRLGPVWVEGQIVQLDQRGRITYAVLRDTDADFSLGVTLFADVMGRLATPLEAGARVVLQAKVNFWPKRGTLRLQASSIRLVGLGELLARIEELKRALAAEGLFAPERKVPLPFAPRVIGLICGRRAKAKDDVVNNARRRWPAVDFTIREVAVQGPACVPEVSAAIAELDADPRVEVIVVARGGGAIEDLLPFSSEVLVRSAAACHTPLVSAIGHEADSPLLDLVADFRASTPTDAAKRIVPDLREESAGLAQARTRLARAMARKLDAERQHLNLICSHRVLADSDWIITSRRQETERLSERAHLALTTRLTDEKSAITTLSAQLRALSPQATLDRGYAVVHVADSGRIARQPADVPSKAALFIQLAGGLVTAIAD